MLVLDYGIVRRVLIRVSAVIQIKYTDIYNFFFTVM